MLNYRHLYYFRAVAHDGNLTRTAERLAISQSALSIQIRSLEDRLGHPLFERRGRRLLLTEAGRIALDHADSLFAIGDELENTLRETGRPRQTLRIGAQATLSRNFLIGFVRQALARPDVEIVLRSGSTGSLIAALEDLALDVVLINQRPHRDGGRAIRSRRLFEQQVSLVGRPDRLRDDDTVASLLAREPVILPGAESGVRMGFDALAERLGLTPRVVAEADDMAMMRLLAREGIGIAVLPPIVVRDELDTGLLREAERLPGLSETFYAVTVARRFPNPLLRELLEGASAIE